MSVRKILTISIVIALVIAASVLSYRYYLLNKTSSILEHVPKSVNTVVYLNTRNLWQKLQSLDSKEKKRPSFERFAYTQHIKDIRETGIDIISDFVAFEYKSSKCFMSMLKDAANFESIVTTAKEGLFSPIVEEKTYKVCVGVQDSFVLAWNQDICVVIPNFNPQKSLMILEEIMNTNKETSFTQNDFYSDLSFKDEIVWFYSSSPPIKDYQNLTLKGWIRFNDGIQIIASSDLKQELNDSTYNWESEIGDNSFYISTKHPELNAFLQKTLAISMGNKGEEVLNLDFNSLEKYVKFGKQEQIENKSVTYEYDDNFNKIEVQHSSFDTIQSRFLYFRTPG
ncbi:MAG: hypothetical protein R2852_08780 [Bacteroidia bacterium]